MTKPNILYFDIETTPMRVWTFRLGDQYIQHGQIVDGDNIDIICITYCWDTGPAYALQWDSNQNSKKMIEAFDKIVKEADIVIGQNSDNFDVKHINTQRMLHGLPPFPQWADATDDTLKQLRKNFKFPSNKLDYISSVLGYGGKVKMELRDWIAIVQDKCPKALAKMVKYGKKDVLDTRKVFHRLKPYITPKLNMSAFNETLCCRNCGYDRLIKNGTRVIGQTRYQYFYCNKHGGHAGKAAISKTGKVGKLT